MMKLEHSISDHIQQFTAYGNGFVQVGHRVYDGSVLVTSQHVQPWRPDCFEALCESDFTELLHDHPELVLLGTGSTIKRPHPRLFAGLTKAQVGVEVMDTGAVCRTFNILALEERRVLALILH